ncbi:FtsX-like permease family protein [uncultured Helicobacter sp.]|uniref:FtsX-like permease family protein n=1 Tax=uncultured Helicobacter sp. TaxID=175537 RepID=UPI001F9BA2EE|nr:FtsX-like permease family protein [uncultured Helicobacter sp.]HIY43415.1 cell division protein FtsX [Candidatus Helicobacter avistercoris]
MRFIKQHLSLIFPLVMLLFSLESAMLVNRAVLEHEKKLSQDYSIVIASKTPVSFAELQSKVKEAKDMREIDPQVVLKDLEHTISAENLEFLKSQLPLFYSITLFIFPNQTELKRINSQLLSISGVQKAELFAKTHSKVYRLLLLLKKSILFFGGLLGVLSIVLMVKQVEIWHLQHSKRMEIMSYLGAPSWTKNKILFKLAVVDSFLSSLFVIAGIFYVLQSEEFYTLFTSLQIDNVIFTPVSDFLSLLLVSVVISTLSAIIVIVRQKDY